MSALHHHHHLSVAPLSRHSVSGLQFRSLLTSDLQIMLCSSSMQQEKNKVLCKSSSCCCCFFTVCPSSPDVSVSVQFIWLLSNVASCFFVFLSKRSLGCVSSIFSTLRCCSNVTVTFVTERLFTVGVCTRLWPLVFGVVPSYFCEFSFILFSHSPECLTKNKTKKKTSPVFTLLPFCQSCSCRWTVLSWRDSVLLNFVKCIYPNLVSMSVKSHDGTVVLFTYNVWII